MQSIDLSGSWDLRQAGQRETILAVVPGCVHTDLLAAGKISDPYYRDHESRLQWIGEADWIYTRHFTVSPDFLNHAKVLLCCDGLDTFANIKINSRAIGQTENMFRTYEFDAQPCLKPGKNTIEVRFTSTIPYIKKREAERHLPAWKGPKDIQGSGWVRKEQCNYGWDWGPALVTCGIWRCVKLFAFDTARINDVYITQKHSVGKVTLNIRASVESAERLSGVIINISASHGGKTVQGTAAVKNDKASLSITIDKPELWGPNGMGAQPLYDVTLTLVDNTGKPIDTIVKRIGLRTFKLERKKDKWGESFAFAVNGVTFFAKGADWIPADTFSTWCRASRLTSLYKWKNRWGYQNLRNHCVSAVFTIRIKFKRLRLRACFILELQRL